MASISDIKVFVWGSWTSHLNLTESAPFCAEILWTDHLVEKKHMASFKNHTGTVFHWHTRGHVTTQSKADGTEVPAFALGSGGATLGSGPRPCVGGHCSDWSGSATKQPETHVANLTQVYYSVYNFNIWFAIYLLQIRLLTTSSTLIKFKLLIWARTLCSSRKTVSNQRVCVCTAQPLWGTRAPLPGLSRPTSCPHRENEQLHTENNFPGGRLRMGSY